VNSREETPEDGNEPRSENNTDPASRSGSAQVAREPPDAGGRRSQGTGAAGDGNDLCGWAQVDGEHPQ